MWGLYLIDWEDQAFVIECHPQCGVDVNISISADVKIMQKDSVTFSLILQSFSKSVLSFILPKRG